MRIYHGVVIVHEVRDFWMIISLYLFFQFFFFLNGDCISLLKGTVQYKTEILDSKTPKNEGRATKKKRSELSPKNAGNSPQKLITKTIEQKRLEQL